MENKPALLSSTGNASKSLIENILEVVPYTSAGANTFTNVHPLWHPPGARGIYGGICIAQSLNAAQATLQSNFCVHSMHGQFILAGNADQALLYHVSRVNDGKSYATRTVKAVQENRIIYTAIINFVRVNGSPTNKNFQHSEPMPLGVPGPPDEHDSQFNQGDFKDPWSKAREKISASGGLHAHQAALAYICDNYFVGTIPHVQNIWDFDRPPLTEFDAGGRDLSLESSTHTRIPASDERIEKDLHPRQRAEERRRIGMMVTLSHTMFFHSPASLKADEWMLSELASHWAGEGRGVATQKIWSGDGTLVATCVQEGVVRLADGNHGHSRIEEKEKSRL